jgi:hypothetical protein
VLWWFTGPDSARLPGFGSQVVKRLIASELHGEGNMLFLSEGVLCTIELPAGEALLEYQ